ncbi:hypothetical protein RHSIM_Rhsim10G0164800 [Rhododendron simsii]|uniref:Uncharacterized protein n=1 Tax=Rhododendron simsii TaxID=118357 RepID=A0A834GC61_RHOSS|nr:hypothetical protein RHSIM_Rhsim10G0164800 [Rhododendron simsii]
MVGPMLTCKDVGLQFEEQERLGSTPPSCHNKCNQCHPCMAVQIPSLRGGHNQLQPGRSRGSHNEHFDSSDVPALCDSTRKNCLGPFVELLKRLNSTAGSPPVTCVVSDGVMSFGIEAAEEIGVPEVQFWTASACSFMGYLHYRELIKRGIFPFKGVVINLHVNRWLLLLICLLKDLLQDVFSALNPMD